MTTTENTITLGEYLFRRLRETGIKSVFGVPGDFNLQLLDYIKDVPELKWVGNTNELNAAYSTDGYSRLVGFGAIITTFGVGELSAVNGIAGSFACRIPLIHIVGMPSVEATKEKLLLHHTLGDRKFDTFEKMSAPISDKTVVLDSIDKAGEIIDDIIEHGYKCKRPVYLGLPSNFFTELMDGDRLKTPLNLTQPDSDPVAEQEFVDLTADMLKKASSPIILVDACASRESAGEQVARLAGVTGYPVFTTPLGKSTFPEDSHLFYGTYVGALSQPDVREIVESADAVLSIGGLPSDYNTGSFTYGYHTLNVVEFHSHYCNYKSATFQNVKMKSSMEKLIEKLKANPSIRANYLRPSQPKSLLNYQTAKVSPGDVPLTQAYLWNRLSYFLKDGDVLVAETGTSSFGILGTHLPRGAKSISQVLWGSIGYSLPSASGASMAVLDQSGNAKGFKRVVLFIGDGSLQLTVQAISDILRWNLPTYLFVLNNNGYTIEKLIHGLHEDYNQIQPWEHMKMLDFFAAGAPHESVRISTADELDNLMNDEAFNKADKTRLVELMLAEFDAPEALVKQAKMSEKMNAGE